MMNRLLSPALDPLWGGSCISGSYRCRRQDLVPPLHIRIHENEYAMETQLISSTTEIESHDNWTESDSFIFLRLSGTPLIEFLSQGSIINSAQYCCTLTKLQKAIKNKRPGLLAQEVILLHYNARPHISQETQRTLSTFHWKVLEQPRTVRTYLPATFTSLSHLREPHRKKVSVRTMEWRKPCRTSSGISPSLFTVKTSRCCRNAGTYVLTPMAISFDLQKNIIFLQLVHFSFGQSLYNFSQYNFFSILKLFQELCNLKYFNI